jgi:hypothetical protein
MVRVHSPAHGGIPPRFDYNRIRLDFEKALRICDDDLHGRPRRDARTGHRTTGGGIEDVASEQEEVEEHEMGNPVRRRVRGRRGASQGEGATRCVAG